MLRVNYVNQDSNDPISSPTAQVLCIILRYIRYLILIRLGQQLTSVKRCLLKGYTEKRTVNDGNLPHTYGAGPGESAG